MLFDPLWRGARLITLAPERPGLGLIENGAIAVSQHRIAYAGPESDLLQGGGGDRSPRTPRHAWAWLGRSPLHARIWRGK